MKRLNRTFIMVCAVTLLPSLVAAQSAQAKTRRPARKVAPITLETNCNARFKYKKYRASCEQTKAELKRKQDEAAAAEKAKAEADAKARAEAEALAARQREAMTHPYLNQNELNVALPGHHFEVETSEKGSKVTLKGMVPEDCAKFFSVASEVRSDEGLFFVHDEGGRGRDCINSKRKLLGVDTTLDANGEPEPAISAPVCDVSPSVKCVPVSSLKGANLTVADNGKPVKFFLARVKRGSEGSVQDKTPVKDEDGKEIVVKGQKAEQIEQSQLAEVARQKMESRRLQIRIAQENISSCKRDNRREIQIALRDLKVLCNSNRMEIQDCSRLEQELGKADRELRMKEATAQFAELQKQARTAKLDELASIREKLKAIVDEFPEAAEKVSGVLSGIASRYLKESKPASEGADLAITTIGEAKALPGLKHTTVASLEELEWQAKGAEVTALEQEGSSELANEKLEGIRVDIELRAEEENCAHGGSMEVCRPLQARYTQIQGLGQQIYTYRLQIVQQQQAQQRQQAAAIYNYNVQVYQYQQAQQAQARQAYMQQMYLASIYGTSPYGGYPSYASYGNGYSSMGCFAPLAPVGPSFNGYTAYPNGYGTYGAVGYPLGGYGGYGGYGSMGGYGGYGGYGSMGGYGGYGGYGSIGASVQIVM